jgi:alanine racemase
MTTKRPSPELRALTPLGVYRPTWAAIDLDAFARNVDAIVKRLPAGSGLIAVLKANGYGHGAIELARRCRHERVAMIAVALLEEALELRRARIALPILLLGTVGSADEVALAASNDITLGVTSPEMLQIAGSFAREHDVAIAMKLDSGMGRVGVRIGDLPEAIEIVRRSPRLRIAAIYTHFANSGDPRDSYTETQMANFRSMVATLRDAGIGAALHEANSGATMRGIVVPGELARVGIALYGGEALEVGESKLEPVMRWRTEIVRLKTLPPGHPVGYGETFRTKRESRIATLPVGYADGYNRLLSNRGEVLVRGRRAPVVGRVSMDLVTIDVTDIVDAQFGDEVVLLGSQESQTISTEEIAALTGTISYEVFCNVSARVPRVYREGDRVTVRSRFTS